jgi:hypothetical protein
MKVYLSGPITGKSNSKERFAKAEEDVFCWAEEVVNPMVIESFGLKGWSACMTIALKWMLDCDAVYMLEGWAASKGANLERYVASQLGLPIFYEEMCKGAQNKSQNEK